MTQIDLFPMHALEDTEAGRLGYERVYVDLGSPDLTFSVQLPSDLEVNRLTDADSLPTPGRELLATIYAPQERNAFMISVIAFSPGFAGYAFTAGESLLFERGYELNETLPPGRVASQSFGLLRAGGEPMRGARVLCVARQSVVLCFLAEFDIDHADSAMRHGGVFGASIRFDNEDATGFPVGAITETRLVLPDGRGKLLRTPSAWRIDKNGFVNGGDWTLAMHYVPEGQVEAFVLMYAEEVVAPQETYEVVAREAVDTYLAANADKFGPHEFLEESALPSLTGVSHRSFMYRVEVPGLSTPYRIRASVIGVEGLTYVVLSGTNFERVSYEIEALFPQWITTTTETMIYESIIGPRP